MDYRESSPEPTSESPKWYSDFPKCAAPCKPTLPAAEISSLKTRAQKCLNGETSAYELKQSRTRGSEYSWLKTALSRGTTSDKVAAGVVLVQDSPKHNLARLTSLVSQVKIAKNNQCSEVMVALKDLFLNDLLHPDHKLLKFEEQDLDQLKEATSQNKLLIDWYFEDQLKEIYRTFIDSLTEIGANAVEASREKAVSVMNDLLIGNAEQEQQLLSLLVNKIGDPSGKVTSKVVFCLQKLLREHPNMKGVILKEVEKLLFRSNINQRVQYYAICLLTQFVLDKEDEDTATYLIDVYFAFFKACLKRGEPKSKMMAAILTGVNRAYPFAKTESVKIKQHVDSVYKVVHLGSFNVALNALSLLFQVCGRNPSFSDRFYSTFYRKLFDPNIGSASKRAVFLNLFFRAIREDKSVVRVAAFIKRMLQVALYFPANMTCATLYVISQVVKSRKDLKRLLSCKQIKPIKVETEEKSEDKAEGSPKDVEKKEVIDEVALKDEREEGNIIISNVSVGPVISHESEIKTEDDLKEDEFKLKQYDPFHRNPLYAGAYNASFSEINALISHFHPSAAYFASSFLEGKNIEYSGDPLKDLSTIHFLDRYVFKNPKKLNENDMKKKRDPLSRRAVYDPRGLKTLPVDSASYLNTEENRIPIDELFLHRYLRSKKVLKGKADGDGNDDDDNASVNSEEFNEMLDNIGKVDDFEELDIAADFVDGTKKKGKSSNKEDAEDENEEAVDDSDDEEVCNLDDEEICDLDEEINDLDDEEMNDLDDLDLDEDLEYLDDDASDIDFSDHEDEKPSKSNKKSKNSENIFMSAEKFAEMLEEQGLSKLKSGSSNTFSDADGSNFKQLKWEMDRNHKLSKPKFLSKNKGKRTKGNQLSGKRKKKQKL